MRRETEQDETEEQETKSWEVENERTETTVRERSGKSATKLITTTTMITEDDNKEKSIERMGNQEMNFEENWHGSETSQRN